MKLGGDYLVLKEYVDFTYWGYKFIVSKYIEKVVKEEPARLLDKIVSAEGMDQVSVEYSFLSQLQKTEQFLSEIHTNRRVCIFHENEDTISLGRVTEYTADNLFVACIDRNFKYEKTPYKIHRRAVSMVELGSEYLRIYRDYAEAAE